MNWAYVHLLINHFPIILSVVASGLAWAAWILRKQGLWGHSQLLAGFAGVSALAAAFVGFMAADELRNTWYVSHAATDTHELVAMLATIFLNWAALMAVWSWREQTAKARVVFLASTTVASLMVAWTGYMGGKIIHESAALEQPAPPDYAGH